MARGHPVDELGRVLPHAWWPSDRQAPGELELVRRFCNSTNRENGAERFRSPAGLDQWLVSEGAEPVACSRSELARLLRLRDALQRLTIANSTGVDDDAAWDELVAVSADVSFAVSRHDSAIELHPTGTPVELLVGRLVGAVLAARADDTWPRLK